MGLIKNKIKHEIEVCFVCSQNSQSSVCRESLLLVYLRSDNNENEKSRKIKARVKFV